MGGGEARRGARRELGGRNGAAEEGIVVEGEQLDAAVDGLGGDFGVAKAAWKEAVSERREGSRGKKGTNRG